MAAAYLDFEKPIAELEAKLQEWEQLSENSKFDTSEEIDALRKKIENGNAESVILQPELLNRASVADLNKKSEG